jgi:hypothetical protein
MNDSYIHPPPEYFGPSSDEPKVDKDPLNDGLEETGEDSD